MNKKDKNQNPIFTAKSLINKEAKNTLRTIVVIAFIYVIMNIITKGRFLTGSNMLAILTNSVVTALIALAFSFIFSMGMIDLSAGAIMIIASNVGGILAIDANLGYFGLIIGSIVVATVLELMNLKIMISSKIPSWIFGLGAAMVYEAIASIYNVSQINSGKQVVSLGNSCRALGMPPWNIVVLVIAVTIAYLIFNRTSIGFGLRAVGSNRTVSSMMGINVSKTILLAGLVGGVFLGIASAVNESYAGRVVPTTGLNSVSTIFIPLATYLLANALEKAFNITISVAVSAFIITSIFNVLTLMGVPSGTWQQVVMGACVLVCGIASQRTFKGVVK